MAPPPLFLFFVFPGLFFPPLSGGFEFKKKKKTEVSGFVLRFPKLEKQRKRLTLFKKFLASNRILVLLKQETLLEN
jgi:hypothetical protein